MKNFNSIAELTHQHTQETATKSLVVVKMGGSTLENTEGIKAFFSDIKTLWLAGVPIVLVHGGGKAIDQKLRRLGIVPQFIEGYRVTDSATMDEVESTLSGKINKDIVLWLNQAGIPAVGISGKDGGLLEVKKKRCMSAAGSYDLGLVGEIVRVSPGLIDALLIAGYMPVIAPIGFDADGVTYNINADCAAAALSGALKASQLLMMTDVSGVYANYPDEKSFLPALTYTACKKLIDHGEGLGGMKPKLESAAQALECGAKSVIIFSADAIGALTRIVIKGEPIGTCLAP